MAQFGLKQSSIKGKEKEETWEEQQKLAKKNIEEILEILLAQHQEAIMAIVMDNGGAKNGKKSEENKSKIGRRLRIAQVAPILSPYPPRKYGGLERVVSYLTEELVHRGHEVFVFWVDFCLAYSKLRSLE